MSDRYNPLLPVSEHSESDLRKIFGKHGDAVAASRLHRENKPLYDSLRKAAVAYKILDAPAYGTPAPNVPYQKPTRQYNSEELVLRGRWSEQEIKNFFANAKEANDLFNSDRDAYEEKRLCAVSFGILPAREVPYVAKPKPVIEPEWKMVISDSLADESSLPRGTEITWPQLQQLIRQSIERRAQEADKQAREAKSDNAE